MLSYQTVHNLLEDCQCSFMGIHLQIVLGDHGGGRWFLQIIAYLPDSPDPQKGGKYYISPHSTEDEVVKKAFLACNQFLEHELRETFQYKGQAIFGPHVTLEALLEASKHTCGRS